MPLWSELPINYSDWAAWQQHTFKQTEASGLTVLEQKVLRAKERLKGKPSLLTLPLDFVRENLRNKRSETVNFKISGPLTQAL